MTASASGEFQVMKAFEPPIFIQTMQTYIDDIIVSPRDLYVASDVCEALDGV